MTKVRKFRSSEVPNFIAYRYNKLTNFNIYIKYPNIRTSEYSNFVTDFIRWLDCGVYGGHARKGSAPCAEPMRT